MLKRSKHGGPDGVCHLIKATDKHINKQTKILPSDTLNFPTTLGIAEIGIVTFRVSDRGWLVHGTLAETLALPICLSSRCT